MDVEKTKILDRQYWKNIEKHTKTVYILYMFASLNENHPKNKTQVKWQYFSSLPYMHLKMNIYIYTYKS
jgi:hypothetical protein